MRLSSLTADTVAVAALAVDCAGTAVVAGGAVVADGGAPLPPQPAATVSEAVIPAISAHLTAVHPTPLPPGREHTPQRRGAPLETNRDG
jgi:hypothetical protein